MTMRALRFHSVGEPAEVLQLDEAPLPSVAANRVRVAVHACGLNPADWALCRGLHTGQLPRGVGLDVSGVVEAIGEGVTDVAIGDRVVGVADFLGGASAGAADFAILDHWAVLPANVDFVAAAALPLAVETAGLHLDAMNIGPGQTVLINGAGTAVGFAAVQIVLLRGARAVATAGDTHEGRLRALGVKVTRYGEGLYQRLQALDVGPIDLALDTAPAGWDPNLVSELVQSRAGKLERKPGADGPLAEVVRAVGGDPHRVVTISDLRSAISLGVRTSLDLLRSDAATPTARAAILRDCVRHAGEGQLSVPVARTFPLEGWREALALSQSWQARGKLVLVLKS
jgi:NADPH:quinone reductase-like Zn-dependent oxidoreductase